MFNPLKFLQNRKVGLALGSGGAKGLAHIAVIEYLEAMNIPIDMISGSSAGALIGAIYFSGNLQQFKADMLTITTKKLLSFIDPVLPVSGLVGTDSLFEWLANYIPADQKIENFPKPLSIIATDYYTGKPVIFTSGNTLSAIRASISLPGIFKPVKYDKTLLIDGGVAEPLPLQILKQMGAGHSIAVNLHPGLGNFKAKKKGQSLEFAKGGGISNHKDSPSLADRIKGLGKTFNSDWILSVADFFEKRKEKVKKEESDKIPSIVSTIMRTIDIMELQNTQLTLSHYKPDVLIEPSLLDFGSLEFYRVEEALTEGKRACEKVHRQLKQKIKLWV